MRVGESRGPVAQLQNQTTARAADPGRSHHEGEGLTAAPARNLCTRDPHSQGQARRPGRPFPCSAASWDSRFWGLKCSGKAL